MAQGKLDEDEKKKPALSSRLMQMKFMQRGKEKSVLKEAVAEQVLSVIPHLMLCVWCRAMLCCATVC